MSPITGGFKLDTINDILPKYLYLPGRTGGQVIGANPHTGGNPTDIALEGRLILGDITGINFTANRLLHIVSSPSTTNNVTTAQIISSLVELTTISGTTTALEVAVTGTPAFPPASGSCTLRGFSFVANCGIPTGITITELISATYSNTIAIYSGTLTLSTVARFRFTGATVIAGGATCPNATGIEVNLGLRNLPTTNARALWFRSFTGMSYSTCNTFKIIDVDPVLANSANITNYYGIYLDVPVNPINKWGYYQKNPDALNVYEGSSVYGALATPNSTVDNQGSQALKITANKTAAYTAAKETIIPCDANTVGAFAVTLPTAVGIPGRIYIIKKVDASANAITVTPAGAETIDGAATVVLNVQWQVTRIVSNGANWLIW